jgi:hypothetical protein
MRRLLGLLVVAALTAGGVMGTGCVVRERAYARGPGYGHACRGGVFVEGHYGPHGRWHSGHWRCPGVVERIEIE